MGFGMIGGNGTVSEKDVVRKLVMISFMIILLMLFM